MSLLTKEETAQLVEDQCQDLEKNGDKKGRGLLHAIKDEDGRKKETFCCLGRLCVVLKEKYGDRLGITSQTSGTFLDRTAYGAGNYADVSEENIHQSLCDKIGLATPYGNITISTDDISEDPIDDSNMDRIVALTEINDDWDQSFSDIAKLIRNHKQELFPILVEVAK